MGWFDTPKCGEPVVVEIRWGTGGFFGSTKKAAKTMPCKKTKGHWGSHDPVTGSD